MSILIYILMFLASVFVTLGGCTLFTNAIEWLGKRLKVPEGAVGSIFAAIGTTLPETSIPVIAIFFGTGQERTEVGLGAILGAPFMLSTLVLPILAGLLIIYARLGKRVSFEERIMRCYAGPMEGFVPTLYDPAIRDIRILARAVAHHLQLSEGALREGN